MLHTLQGCINKYILVDSAWIFSRALYGAGHMNGTTRCNSHRAISRPLCTVTYRNVTVTYRRAFYLPNTVLYRRVFRKTFWPIVPLKKRTARIDRTGRRQMDRMNDTACSRSVPYRTLGFLKPLVPFCTVGPYEGLVLYLYFVFLTRPFGAGFSLSREGEAPTPFQRGVGRYHQKSSRLL